MGQTSTKNSDDNSNEPSEIPQAGGHGGIKRSTELPGTIMKVGRGTEIEFYQAVNGELAAAIPDDIKALFPKFYGVQSHFLQKFVIMEDLTAGMAKPCIMDIKMGTQTWEPNTINVIKRYQLETKDNMSTSRSLGFRITGMRVYRKDLQQYVVHDKETCLTQVKVDTCEAFLKQFFMDGEKFRQDALAMYIKRMTRLLAWFETQNRVRFIGNSLLFIYDSESDHKDMRMIDFAHVIELTGESARDEGYILGLRTLLKIFRRLRKGLKHRDSKMNATVD